MKENQGGYFWCCNIHKPQLQKNYIHLTLIKLFIHIFTEKKTCSLQPCLVRPLTAAYFKHWALCFETLIMASNSNGFRNSVLNCKRRWLTKAWLLSSQSVSPSVWTHLFFWIQPRYQQWHTGKSRLLRSAIITEGSFSELLRRGDQQDGGFWH